MSRNTWIWRLSMVYMGLSFFSAWQCNDHNPAQTDDESHVVQAAGDSAQVVSAPRIAVKLFIVEKKDFSTPIFSNGTLTAGRKLTLSMPAGGQLIYFPWQAGQIIKAGEVIARVDQHELEYQIQKQQTKLALALEEKNDRLFTQGGKRGDDNSVSIETLNYIELSTGYRQAKDELAYLQHQLTLTELHAPFTALVTETKAQVGQRMTSGQDLVMVLDPASLQVHFKVLEHEAVMIKAGTRAWVEPVALPGIILPAQVKTVIPVVSKEGLVEVVATAITRHPALMEGMTVQVKLDRLIPHQLIVPKEALVLRSGKAVIFTFDPASGLAKWNYVQVAHENDRFLAISEGLQPGDQVIVSGNTNLAHDAEVEVINN